MSRAESFNYAVLKDAALRNRVKKQAAEIKGLMARTAATVVEIGQRLIEVQGMLGISMREWCRVEFEWSQALASNYMRAAKRFGDLDCLDHFQPTALFALARNAVPEKAIKAAIAAAQGGKLITRLGALELIEAHGGKPARSDAGRSRSKAGNGLGAAVEAAAPVKPVKPVDALRSMLGNFAGQLEALSADERESLADEFLGLAFQLRSLSRSTAAA